MRPSQASPGHFRSGGAAQNYPRHEAIPLIRRPQRPRHVRVCVTCWRPHSMDTHYFGLGRTNERHRHATAKSDFTWALLVSLEPRGQSLRRGAGGPTVRTLGAQGAEAAHESPGFGFSSRQPDRKDSSVARHGANGQGFRERDRPNPHSQFAPSTPNVER